MSAKGSLFMTTRRITFVCKKVTTTRGVSLAAFDLPFTFISGEKFNQPIFGANYLSGIVAPVPGMGLPQPGKFRLTFNNGGVGTFLRFFFIMMDQARRAASASSGSAAAAPVWDPTPPDVAEAVRSGAFAREQQAYVDPTDPTTLFIAQPSGTVVGDVPYMAGGSAGGAPAGYPSRVPRDATGAGGAGGYPTPVASTADSSTPPAAGGPAPSRPPGLGGATPVATAPPLGPPPGLSSKKKE